MQTKKIYRKPKIKLKYIKLNNFFNNRFLDNFSISFKSVELVDFDPDSDCGCGDCISCCGPVSGA